MITERKVDIRHAAAIAAVGCLGSGVFGYVLARSKAKREYSARLDAEVAALKEHYTRPIIPSTRKIDVVSIDTRRPTWAATVKETLNGKAELADPFEGLDGSHDQEAADETNGSGEEGTGTDGDGVSQVPGTDTPKDLEEPDHPFELTEAQFGELNDEGFQTISVTYYAADKVLTDDKDDPIRDIVGTVGTLNPLGFGGISNDPHIRYVRNRRLEVDFEILLNAGSYTETILGYGQPNRKREANPASAAK